MIFLDKIFRFFPHPTHAITVTNLIYKSILLAVDWHRTRGSDTSRSSSRNQRQIQPPTTTRLLETPWVSHKAPRYSSCVADTANGLLGSVCSNTRGVRWCTSVHTASVRWLLMSLKV